MDFISQKSLKHSQVEEGVVLNEAYVSSPRIQVLFQDSFADLLEAFEEGVKHVKSSLMQNFNNILGTTVQTQMRWEWPFDFSKTVKELNQDPPWNHILDWLYWKTKFTS